MKGMLMCGLWLCMRGARVSTQANGAAITASRGRSCPQVNPLAPVSHSNLVGRIGSLDPLADNEKTYDAYVC